MNDAAIEGIWSTKKLRTLFGLVMLTSVNSLAISFFSPGIPQIAEELKLSSTGMSLTIIAFLFPLGASQLGHGPLSDHFGRKRVLNLALGASLAGCIACALATNQIEFIAARIAWGLGGGGIAVCARALLREQFGGVQLNKAVSTLIFGAAVVSMLAPAFGGFLIQTRAWRIAFVIQSIYVALVWAGFALWFPMAKTRNVKRLQWSRACKIYRAVLANSTFRIGMSGVMCAYAIEVLCLSMSPSVFQVRLGVGPESYGMILIFPVVAEVFGNFAAALLDRHGSTLRPAAVGAVFILAAGACLLSLESLSGLTVLSAVAAIAAAMFGAGLVFAECTAESLRPFMRTAGTSAALAGLLQHLGAGAVVLVLSSTNARSGPSLGGGFLVCGLGVIVTSFMMWRHPRTAMARTAGRSNRGVQTGEGFDA
ncbi:MFS transporter [Ralstonia pseudosolanacearum]|uniref:MFS transporter n=1 Tax=Ralstonia pseudosolanacearum TaxID=1310165 RepID=UPI00142DE35D|nr:MFS transporter [Ralstonia pseudosolanacearum]